MTKEIDYVVVGKVGASYGVKGWLKVTSFTASPSDILGYAPWYLQDKNSWKPMDITQSRPHGKGVIIKISGLDTPEEARLLTGKTIAIKRSQLAVLKKHEYYWSDLEGLTVIDQNGQDLGKIIYLMETGANDVLVVKGKKEHAIPYLPGDVIIDIDLEKQEMRVNWEVI